MNTRHNHSWYWHSWVTTHIFRIILVQEENNDENQNEEEDSDEENELPAIPIKEGLEALEKIMTCLLQQHKDCPDEIKKLTSVKNTMKKIYWNKAL